MPQINGRAAMLAFVAAVGAEINGRAHMPVLSQFHSVGGFCSFLLVSAVVTIATFMVSPPCCNAHGVRQYTPALASVVPPSPTSPL